MEVTPEILRDCEKYVLDNTGNRIALAIKPMVVPTSFFKTMGIIPDNLEANFFPIFDPENMPDEQQKNKTPLFREKLYPDNPVLDDLAKTMIIERTHGSIAECISELWKDEFYYGDKCWWNFSTRQHRWTSSPSAMTHAIVSRLYAEFDRVTDWKDKDEDENLCDALYALKIKLADFNFIKSISSLCVGFFEQKDYRFFKSSLNKDLNLLAFKNGIFDLEKGRLRDGKPSDMISVQIGYAYQEYEHSGPERNELFDILRQIFPDEDTFEYIFLTLACALGGKRTDKLRILLGDGANGKSVLTSLMEQALDCYACSWSAEMLCVVFDPTAPNPELEKARYARFINIQEGRKQAQFNMDTFKKFTGGDTLNSRNLFETSKSSTPFVLRAQMVFSLNTLMAMTEANHAAWRRLEVVEMLSTFVEAEEQVDEENHIYLADEISKADYRPWPPCSCGYSCKDIWTSCNTTSLQKCSEYLR
ncbi:hypothetical protein HKX48_002784 [Thoreauomyces humboldtii]|nr:hypothetical protein HKX48_002784 [Thoreauomyces humboldtii]